MSSYNTPNNGIRVTHNNIFSKLGTWNPWFLHKHHTWIENYNSNTIPKYSMFYIILSVNVSSSKWNANS